ncbi:alcohol-forming fatty acyl-CoA reductase-like [Triticum aestivum]|uniref:alcohol-forming fatty acyl-CoA reductase-like n=1 Tax=Triticum aestivum TaxID=4565 RepID=UPI001D031AE4|nr:alcohol-forming fatty acyl-CoA reductase-like [Triticum aestivum]
MCRYDVALNSNALGAKNVCEFGKKCCNMKLLLHVSTAFVAGTQEGLLLERAFHNGETLREGYYLDIEEELQLVRNVKTELMEALSDSSEKLEKSKMKELGLKRPYKRLMYKTGKNQDAKMFHVLAWCLPPGMMLIITSYYIF